MQHGRLRPCFKSKNHVLLLPRSNPTTLCWCWVKQEWTFCNFFKTRQLPWNSNTKVTLWTGWGTEGKSKSFCCKNVSKQTDLTMYIQSDRLLSFTRTAPRLKRKRRCEGFSWIRFNDNTHFMSQCFSKYIIVVKTLVSSSTLWAKHFDWPYEFFASENDRIGILIALILFFSRKKLTYRNFAATFSKKRLVFDVKILGIFDNQNRPSWNPWIHKMEYKDFSSVYNKKVKK